MNELSFIMHALGQQMQTSNCANSGIFIYIYFFAVMLTSIHFPDLINKQINEIEMLTTQVN